MGKRIQPVTPQDGVAWITGASSGIGREVALKLAQQGWTVVASARSADKLTALGEEAASLPGRVHSEPLDVTDQPAVLAAVSRIEAEHGPIALAVLNAGTYTPDGVDGFSRDAIEKTVGLNLLAGAGCLEALLPKLRERRRGQVALVASVAGYRGLPRAAAYSGSKAGAIAMMESLHLDAQRYNILLQVINPGFVDTPLTAKNDFPMPFLVPVEKAAGTIVRGLAKGRFEIAFPTPFVAILKAMRCLPYAVYFWAIGRQTGAGQ